jgi:hypothetical protein
MRVEVACDESGYESEKLIGGTTDVFAHASVVLDAESAAACMRELRRRIRSPATEYKANHLLREKHRAVLVWLLGPSGPLHGYARVYLMDKAFFVLRKVTELLLDDSAVAVDLYREGPRTFGQARWEDFLVAANNLMRAKDRLDVGTPVDAFFHTVEALRRGGPGILDVIGRTRPRAAAFRARLLDDPALVPALDPLIPAIVRAVVHWGDGGRPVSVVHDRQDTLSGDRIAQLKEIASTRGAVLASLRFVDSGFEPRVQVADILAGTARKITSNGLNGRGDAQLTALLRPYVDPSSMLVRWDTSGSRSP